jgi:uncharacterized protein (DUF1330 family)
MILRLRPAAVAALYREPLPGPVDVLNLIHLRRPASYRAYGAMVSPLLALVGASLRWAGRHEAALHGPVPAETLLVMRYPSHRRFIWMTLNPYYLLINRLRERGVERFEASFTRASNPGRGLHRVRRLLAVHYRAADPDAAEASVAALLEPHLGAPVYASRSVASLGAIAQPPRPTDPNPLTLPQVAFFAIDDDGSLPGEVLDALGGTVEEAAVHVYRRESVREMLTGSRP